MARTETMVQLTDELVELLDEEAARRGISRSALIREILTAGLAEAADGAVVRSIVAGYTRLPQAMPDEWGSLEEQADRSATEVACRLDVEERAAGHEPW